MPGAVRPGQRRAGWIPTELSDAPVHRASAVVALARPGASRLLAAVAHGVGRDTAFVGAREGLAGPLSLAAGPPLTLRLATLALALPSVPVPADPGAAGAEPRPAPVAGPVPDPVAHLAGADARPRPAPVAGPRRRDGPGPLRAASRPDGLRRGDRPRSQGHGRGRRGLARSPDRRVPDRSRGRPGRGALGTAGAGARGAASPGGARGAVPVRPARRGRCRPPRPRRDRGTGRNSRPRSRVRPRRPRPK